MSKTRRIKPYQLRLHNGTLCACPRAEWERIVARGFASPETNGAGQPSRRIAAVRRGVVVSEVGGRLHVIEPARPDSVQVGTNAAMVDRQWVFSNAGRSPIPRRIELEIRRGFDGRLDAAEEYLREKRRQWRSVLVAEQFGILAPVVI